MSEFTDNFPLFVRTEEDIRADWDARVNVNLDPDNPDFMDTSQGSPFHLATQPQIVEFAAIYDRLNEVLAAGIFETSWGLALDSHAAGFGLERKPAQAAIGEVTFVGTPTTIIGSGATVGVAQTNPEQDPQEYEITEGGVIPDAIAPATLGVLTLPVRARLEGVAGNVPVGAITLPMSALSGVSSLSNLNAITGGLDVESDDSLRARIKVAFLGGGTGSVNWYARMALAEPGVGRVTVVPAWNGPGTVLLIILDDNGDPVLPAIIASLLARLDPVPGAGEGEAPINHDVSVVTAAVVLVSVSATVLTKPGYALDSSTGQIAIGSQIEAYIREYIDGLSAGDDVVFNHVRAQFFRVDGVLDVTNLLVNGGTAATVSITTDPPQVAQSNAVTLV